jgi:hypothetical protein
MDFPFYIPVFVITRLVRILSAKQKNDQEAQNKRATTNAFFLLSFFPSFFLSCFHSFIIREPDNSKTNNNNNNNNSFDRATTT